MGESLGPEVKQAGSGSNSGKYKILLAEDRAINQKVMASFLRKKGWLVTTVSNGREAVAAVQSRKFDLILMDVQMPEIDGLEAVREIRRLEQKSGRHVPIVAMTAYAMSGDREKCLEAGMDDYVAKPVDFTKLEQVITRSLALPAAGDDAGSEAPVNLAQLLNNLDGNMELVKELARELIEGCPYQMEEMRTAAVNADYRRLERVAHEFKGAIANFGAGKARDLAFELEKMGRDGSPGRFPEVIAELEREMELFRQYFCTT